MNTKTNDDTLMTTASTTGRGLMIALGIIMILVGTAAIIFPVISTLSVVWAVGFMLVVASIVQSVAVFSNHSKWGATLLGLAVAALWLVGGGLLLMRPFEGVFALTVIVASVFLVEGVIKTVISFQTRPARGWGWILFDGIATLLLGGLLWWKLPSAALWALGTLAGISIMLSGWTLIIIPRAVLAVSTGGFAVAPEAKS